MGNSNSGLKPFKSPFKIGEEESEYWLGYLCADGNIQYSKKYRIYKVSLFSKDKEIIDKFIQFIGPRCRYHKRKQNGIHEAYIFSRDLCEELINKYNIVPKKSLILNPNLPQNNHVIRGYFDGDGSIRKNKKECKLTTGSEKFKNFICDYLDWLGIYYVIRKKGNAFDICLERKKECIDFLTILYKDSKIHLKRKFEQFVALTSDS